jgi:hypothetical protein
MKKIKSFLLAGVLALAAISVAGAKSYDIVLSSPCKAGDTQLKAGEYRLKVEGTKATFVDVRTAKSYTVDVHVETTGTKSDDTIADYSLDGGGIRVMKDIRIGGTTTKLNF